MSVQLVRGDAAHLPLPDSSVDLVVTSPPYFALRSYQDQGGHYAGQIGSEATPAEFVDALIRCTAEWVRVLKPCGSLWVNLGDKYAGSAGDQGGANRTAADHGYYYRNGKSSAVNLAPTVQKIDYGWGGVKPKSLMGLPWRYALRCIDDLGLILRAEVIWSKPNGLPESVTDRVRRSHEQWFHFVQQPRYYAAVDTIREPQNGSHQKEGTANRGRGFGGDALESGTFSKDGGFNAYREQNGIAYNPLGKLPGSVWSIPSQPLTVPPELGVDHFAAFPMEWPRRLILGWSPSGICVRCGEGRRPVSTTTAVPSPRKGNVGTGRRWRELGDDTGVGTDRTNGNGAARYNHETTVTGECCACPDTTAPSRPSVILDPFGGTGTVALMADVLGRHGISVDMSADYCRLAKWRTTDPGQRATAMQVDKPEPVSDGQQVLWA